MLSQALRSVHLRRIAIGIIQLFITENDTFTTRIGNNIRPAGDSSGICSRRRGSCRALPAGSRSRMSPSRRHREQQVTNGHRRVSTRRKQNPRSSDRAPPYRAASELGLQRLPAKQAREHLVSPNSWKSLIRKVLNTSRTQPNQKIAWKSARSGCPRSRCGAPEAPPSPVRRAD